ncbi:hypothetical protein CRUP_010694 [Coryphaenoides rupestris]|nr:hypothetical protein CRUP_010694 [Coryphaenoides rupestris]
MPCLMSWGVGFSAGSTASMSFMAPPGYQPIYNPSIPYTGPIYGGLRNGTSIYFQGRGDAWDSEEHTRDMPFVLGEGFEMVIMITAEGYQVATVPALYPYFKVNGREFYTMSHRIPLERGGYPGGQGGYPGGQGGYPGGQGGYPGGQGGEMGGGYPGGQGGYPGDQGGYPGGQGGYPGGQGGYPGGQGGYPGGPGGMGGGDFPGSNLPGMGGQPDYNPSIPFSTMIPGGMSSKRTIIIRGMIPYGGDRFSVNLKASRSSDIAFHMNPRVSEGIVVRNSLMDGNWGEEERELAATPFMEGQYFDMSIRCGNRRFKVFVNGQHLLDFFHRLQPFTQVDMLEVEGDVQISYIHY